MMKITRLPLEGFTPLNFFAKLRPSEQGATYFTSGQWTIIAWNPSKTIRSYRAKDIDLLKKKMRSSVSPSTFPFTGGWIGFISYDLGLSLHGLASSLKDRSRVPLFVLHRYDHAVLWNGKNVYVLGDAAFRAETGSIHARALPDPIPPLLEWAPAVTKAEYARRFGTIRKGIRRGEYYQLNLTYPFVSRTDASPRELFVAFARGNSAACTSYVEDSAVSILSLSPERFVTVDKGTINTFPIKGTRPRGRGAEDRRLARELLASPKEAAELNMITDLLRNDIGKISVPGSVRVKGHRLLQKNPFVWHTYSVIEGKLLASVTPLDAFLSMFPGGSVTGCPKVSAMKEIDRLERARRGPYCGSMILLSDSGYFDSTILIRTVAVSGDRLSLGVGGGIVAESDADGEYDETLRKAASFLQPLRIVRINGRTASPHDFRLRLLDPSNPHSFGLFETMVASRGKIQGLTAHLRRLRRSAKILDFRLPATIRSIEKQVKNAVHNANERRPLRVKIVCTPADVLVDVRPLPDDLTQADGVTVTVVHLERSTPGVKALPYHEESAAFRSAQEAGFAEVLLRREDGCLPEAAYSNLFWVKDGVLHTPDEGMLPGITRSRVLRLAKKKGIRTRYALPNIDDLVHADEVFLTRSLAGVIPVIRIGTRTIGTGRPGGVTSRLRREMLHSL